MTRDEMPRATVPPGLRQAALDYLDAPTDLATVFYLGVAATMFPASYGDDITTPRTSVDCALFDVADDRGADAKAAQTRLIRALWPAP